MNYYYRVPHEKYETEKEGRTGKTLSLSLSFSDLSDQKFGLQPSKTYSLAGENNVQIFTPALENMTALLFI